MNTPVLDLEVVEQFLNTLDERSFTRHGEQHAGDDTLTTPQALSDWLTAHDLPAPEHVTGTDLGAARSLRQALRGALLGGGPDLDGFPLHLVADTSGRLRMTAATGVPGLDAIVEAVAHGVGSGRWNRLKLCASEDCRWAFYDTSRSGGGRWCSMGTCGNRHKTRAYRQRQA